MIVTVIGWFCLVLATAAFIGAWRKNYYNLDSSENMRDFCLLLIVAAICFK